jgi:hypothetical protein
MFDKLTKITNQLSTDSKRFAEDDNQARIDLLMEYAIHLDREMTKIVIGLGGSKEYVDFSKSLELCFQYVR